MPFTLPTIEPDTKAEFPNAYWDWLGFGVEKNNKLVYIVFAGWASKAAHDADADHISGLEKRLNFSGPAYKAAMKALQQSDQLVTKIATKIDDLALAQLYVDSDEKDEDGNPIRVLFFANATRLDPDLSVLQ